MARNNATTAAHPEKEEFSRAEKDVTQKEQGNGGDNVTKLYLVMDNNLFGMRLQQVHQLYLLMRDGKTEQLPIGIFSSIQKAQKFASKLPGFSVGGAYYTCTFKLDNPNLKSVLCGLRSIKQKKEVKP